MRRFPARERTTVLYPHQNSSRKSRICALELKMDLKKGRKFKKGKRFLKGKRFTKEKVRSLRKRKNLFFFNNLNTVRKARRKKRSLPQEFMRSSSLQTQ